MSSAVRLFGRFLCLLVAAAWLMQPAMAEPQPVTTPAGADAAAAAPEAPPKPPAAAAPAVDLDADIKAQDRSKAIDDEIAATWTLVNRAKKMALDFHLARAEITDILNSGKCGGVDRVLASLDTQQSETLKLSAYLAERCAAATEGTDLKRTCIAERGKIDTELAGYEKDRDTLRRMCPKK